MFPSEFRDCTYKEAVNFVQSFYRNQERELKNKVILFEHITDKLLYNNPQVVKKPQKIRLLERYKDLFKDDFLIKPQTEEEQYKFVMELQEEIKQEKRGDTNKWY